MNERFWWTREEAEVRVTSTDSLIPASRALPPTGLIYSARMQGQEMRDADGVFTQFYEALRLPSYFGWNWNALRDCLQDLHWLAATHFLLVIDDAEAVLSEEPEEREILWRALNDSVTFWAGKPELPGQEKSSFDVVLLCPSDIHETLRAELLRP
ncbi:barstar (barnase inhibitor) [Streptomyces puniciscabiei]|uniref:Barstar (Barnase inhibitor) n=1 Tax=Streptomyces puniciscabiei TaxID=164348 RepID=A0A542UAV9_9ACTN|nr:barstar family protein [Streptomyces puniciscabiei]TQK96161.1 barstar (barnase inhibitor) [Streptomyces puniciscabiei]